MFSMMLSYRAMKLAAAALVAASLGACASKTDDADALNGGLNGRNGLAGAAVPGSAQDFVVNIGDRVFFETDSTELTSTGVATLDKQANWLNRYPRYAFTVEGHAAERGTREYNFALSARRAETVRNYLGAKGIAASRIKTMSYGKERPVAVCDNVSCWSQNRRAVTVLNGAGS